MPARRIQVESGGRRGAPAPKGMFASAYDSLTSPDNASMVRSVAVFGVCFACYLSLSPPSSLCSPFATLELSD